MSCDDWDCSCADCDICRDWDEDYEPPPSRVTFDYIKNTHPIDAHAELHDLSRQLPGEDWRPQFWMHIRREGIPLDSQPGPHYGTRMH